MAASTSSHNLPKIYSAFGLTPGLVVGAFSICFLWLFNLRAICSFDQPAWRIEVWNFSLYSPGS